MGALVIHPLAGAGHLTRLVAAMRGFVSRRLIPRLPGVEVVVLAGHVRPVRAVPLGVAREMVPAIVRCSRAFAQLEIGEALYDDLIKVVSLGLGMPLRQVENLAVSLWDLAPVLDRIARVNGLPVVEAGGPDLGKLLATLTGTSSTPGSSAQPAGPGGTSTNA